MCICWAPKNCETILSEGLNKQQLQPANYHFLRPVAGQLLFWAVIAWLMPVSLFAQPKPGSEEELIEYAARLFDEERYDEALGSYSQLLSLHPTSAQYNYRYGACMVYGASDKEQAFKHLNYALGKEGVPPEIHFFLGKAHHLSYRFNEALEQYRLYEQKGGGKRGGKTDVSLAIEQCQNGMNLLSNIKDITVLNKVETSEKEFFRNYDLSSLGGRILVCPDELLSPYDLKTGERFLMYFPGNTSTVFFSSYGKKGDSGRDIYRATRMPNGSWSKPIAMTGINTPYNDDFPYLHPDGQTFYFSSEGHSSMGGFDIFKATYNSATDAFTKPENLDFAINTPDNDVFYITDKNNELAFFASSRSSDQGRMHVYQVQVAANPLQLVFIKGSFSAEAPGVTSSARITVLESGTNRKVGEFATDPLTGNYLIDLPMSGRYQLIVDAQGSELAHNGLIEVPANDKAVAYAQQIELLLVNNTEKLIITNSFDQPLNEDLFALARDVIKYRAGLDVNLDKNAQDVLPVAAADDNANFSNAYVEAGFSPNLSNEVVLEKIENKFKTLENKSATMRNQMDLAYTLAQEKKQQASKAARDAEDFLRLADAVGEEEVSKKYYMQAAASRHAAQNLAREARTALRLSAQLNERLAEVEQEEQRALLTYENVQSGFESGDYTQFVSALGAAKKAEEEERAGSAIESDEYQLLREIARNQRKSADIQTQLAQELRDEERSLEMRIKNRKLQMESAKTKDKPDIQREIDALEEDLAGVRIEIEQLFGGLESEQETAALLDLQAELYRKIDSRQNDTYISPEKIKSFDAESLNQIENSIAGIETDASGMELNMNIVRDIIEEDSNVAIGAFENTEEYQSFVAAYDLPAAPERAAVDSQPDEMKNPEVIIEDSRDQIAAAEDWIAIIDQSMSELEEERKNTEVEARREEIDVELEKFQELKHKHALEIESARERIAEAEEMAAAPFTAGYSFDSGSGNSDDSGQVANQGGTDYRDRPSLTVVQFDPVYDRIDPTYLAARESIAENAVSTEDELRKRVALDREFLQKVNDQINGISSSGPALTEADEKELETLEMLRNEIASEMAFAESEIAAFSGSRPKTSTEILMEAGGLAPAQPEIAENPNSEPGETESSTSAEVEPVAGSDQAEITLEDDITDIPESVDYEDIDPGYTNRIQSIRTSDMPEQDRLLSEKELNEVLIERIDEKITDYRNQAAGLPEDDQLKVERLIGQLQQVKAVTESEIEIADEELQAIRKASFRTENELVTEEVDEEYVDKYLAIEESDESEYLKSVAKARLEQEIAEGIESRIAALTVEMDAAESVSEQQAIQEKIQDLQLLRQEKVVAYESWYASADNFQKSGEKPSTADAEAAVDESELSDENLVSASEVANIPDNQESGESDPDAAPQSLSDDLASESTVDPATGDNQFRADRDTESSAAPTESMLQSMAAEIVDDEEYFARLSEWVVFGEASDAVYKSLGASLAREALGGDIQRHHQRILDFAALNKEEISAPERQSIVEQLLQNDLKLQERLTPVNQLEWDYYTGENEELVNQLETAVPENALNEFAMAREQIAEANSLKTRAGQLRSSASESADPFERMSLVKEAFNTELLAIEKMARANYMLEEWSQGNFVTFEDAAGSVIPVLQQSDALNTAILLAQEAPLVEERPSDTDNETSTASESVVETTIEVGEPVVLSDVAAIREELEQTTDELLAEEIGREYELSPEEMERLRNEPEYLNWFRYDLTARKLEAQRVEKAALAGNYLDRAEEALTESESLAIEAENEADEQKRIQMNNRAAGLQDEARSLFELASKLREELAQYNNEVEGARERADEVLELLGNQKSAELLAMTAASASSGDETAGLVNEIELPEPDTETAQENTPDVVVQDSGQTAADEVPTFSSSPEIAANTPSENRVEPVAYPAIPELRVGINEDLFMADEQAAYSDENPIPVNIEWPEGLVFAVQVGAFRNPIPQDLFQGFSPIRGERVADGITRYSAGLFTEFTKAISARNTIRGKGYGDAFVVAYLNGERIPLNRALSEADAAGIIAESQGLQVEQAAVSSEPVAAVVPEAVQAESREEVTPDSEDIADSVSPTAYYNEPGAAPATQVERIRGLFYTVQVGVYSKPVASEDLFNITPLNSELTSNGYIRYTSGMFPDLNLAQSQRQVVINSGVADAFITAYYNGSRISISEAKALVEREGPSVFAGARSAPAAEPDNTPEVSNDQNNDAGNAQPAGRSSGSEPELMSAYDFEAKDIRFVLDLGSFGEGMPQETADAILEIPDAGITRLQLPNGKMHYLSKPLRSFNEVEELSKEFQAAGVEDVVIRAMALGFLLNVDEAREVAGQ